MKRYAFALAGVAAALIASPLQAQTCNTDATVTHAAATAVCTVAVNASVTVHDVMRLTLGSATQDLGTPNEADFDVGRKDAAGTTATVKSNRPWRLTVVAQGAFGYTGSLGGSKPASDLLWGTIAGTYGNNAGTSALLSSGNGTDGSDSGQQIFFRTLWSWTNDVPGSYAITLDFTLATP